MLIKGQLTDQNDELELLKTKFNELDISEKNKKEEEMSLSGKSLEDELMLANDNLEKEDLKKELNSMKMKIDKFEKKKLKRNVFSTT